MTRAFGNKVGVRLIDLSTREHIDFIQCTFARADTWALWQDGFPEDRPIESLRDVLALGFRGYVRMADYAPPLVRGLLVGVTSLTAWVVSFIPRGVGRIRPWVNKKQWVSCEFNRPLTRPVNRLQH